MKQLIYILFTLQLILSSCIEGDKDSLHEEMQALDLQQIIQRGKIIAVTDYNTANYFVYKGSPMGFQFELLQDFADHIGLQLELKVQNGLDEKVQMLENQECDLIATNLAITQEKRQVLTFTEPHSQTKQVLIQRKNHTNNGNAMLKDQMELAGKTIYIRKNSAYSLRLKNLSNEIGDSIIIKEVDETDETLIEWVSKGKIDYSVSYENIALVNTLLYDNIDISIPVSFTQNLGWVVRSTSPELLSFINNWLVEYKKTTKYHVLYRKYFINGNIESIARSEFSTFGVGRMSAYDHAIKKYSEQIGWDWRLLASLIYQESRFNPDVKSWAGAYGIMQLMPNTARKYGVDTTSAPEEHIQAGVKLLKWLDNKFENEIPDKDERIKFVLASYNIGYGHVRDAQNLARKHGMDPNIWNDNVEFYLLSKSKPEFYNDSVVKYGYCKGTETYKYVKEIIERYQHYTNLFVEN